MPPRLGNLLGISTIRPRTSRSCGIVGSRYSRSPASASRTCRSNAATNCGSGVVDASCCTRISNASVGFAARNATHSRSTSVNEELLVDEQVMDAQRAVPFGVAAHVQEPDPGVELLRGSVLALHPQRGHEVDHRRHTTEACSRVVRAGDGDAA